jgi:hypothetical protein
VGAVIVKAPFPNVFTGIEKLDIVGVIRFTVRVAVVAEDVYVASFD